MCSDESRGSKGRRVLQESLVAIQWECGPLPLTLECAMMISTRNRDEKNGPPFVNGLGTFEKTLILTAREARCRKTTPL